MHNMNSADMVFVVRVALVCRLMCLASPFVGEKWQKSYIARWSIAQFLMERQQKALSSNRVGNGKWNGNDLRNHCAQHVNGFQIRFLRKSLAFFISRRFFYACDVYCSHARSSRNIRNEKLTNALKIRGHQENARRVLVCERIVRSECKKKRVVEDFSSFDLMWL